MSTGTAGRGSFSGPGARVFNGPGARGGAPPGSMNGPAGRGGIVGGNPGMGGPPGAMGGPGMMRGGPPGAMGGPGMGGPPGGMMMGGPPGAMMRGGPPGAMGGPPGGMMMGGPPGGMMMGGPPGGMMMGGPPGMMGGPPGGMAGGGAMTGGGMAQMTGPPCDVCQQPIVGRLVNAVGKTYHPDHFVCEYCSQPFPGGKFLVGPDKKLYCENDFMELYAKVCAVCSDVIRGKAVSTSNGKSYHSEHFLCVACGLNLVGKQYKSHKETELIYCPKCLEKEEITVRPEAHMCAMCSEPIVGHYLKIKGQFLHPRHFRCEECGCEFKGGDCREFEGDFYCIPHYEILLLKKCAKCGKPCKGRSLTALGKSWHIDHFTCHICNEPFTGPNFFENDGLPYCQTHYVQLFGDNCADCHLPITSGGAKFLGKAFHDGCFKCSQCAKELKSGDFTSWDSKPMCIKCYKQIPKTIRKRVEQRVGEEKKAKQGRRKAENAAWKDIDNQ